MGVATTEPDPIERALEAALDVAASRSEGCPPKLGAAMRHAVFAGGARVRPRLCLAAARACGADEAGVKLALAAGAAVELIHCASLAHDDLPCFDGAELRRGRPSVHAAFGEPLAVLAGDALIVLAFEAVAAAGAAQPAKLPGLLAAVARGAGAPSGIAAGQGWESEPLPDLARYHQAKTGALFVAAAGAGAIAAGVEPEPWRELGRRLGQAYQVADDVRDALATSAETGKPGGRDEACGRPSAVRALGPAAALARMEALIARAAAAVPPCRGRAALEALIAAEAERLRPKNLPARLRAAAPAPA